MKRMQLFSAALVLLVAASFTSCKPSRVWATKDKNKDKDHDRRDERPSNYDPPPPPRTTSYYATSLVITPTPGFVMNRSSDGRYFHRTNNNLLYWKGYDNRFFLDRSYFRPSQYSYSEYDQWRRVSGQR